MPQYANSNWYNSHNFYGELKDIEAAKLDEVQAFFKTYYAPNNAALAVVGDFEPEPAKAMIAKYFGGIPAAPLPPTPDLTEPRQDEEKTASRKDPLASHPALAFAYHMPPRRSPEYYAMGLLDQMLVQGDDSLLYQELVKKHGFTGDVSGGINELGGMFDYDGPMLWTVSLFHDAGVKPEQILSAVDTVIEGLRANPVEQSLLDRSVTKIRSSLYDSMAEFGGFGRANLMACFALFDDDPSGIDSLEADFRKVTPQLIERTAREYLRKTARTVLLIEPGADSSADGQEGPA
jgi:zinc protease